MEFHTIPYHIRKINSNGGFKNALKCYLLSDNNGWCRSIVLLCCVCVFFNFFIIIIIIIIINLQSSKNIYLPQKIFTRVYYDYLIYYIIFITTIIIKNNDVSSLHCFKKK